MAQEIIKTKRLILREYTKDDAPFALQLLNSPGFLKFIGDRQVRSLNDAEEYIIKRIIPSYSKNGYGMWLVSAEGKAIGTCGLVNREDIEEIDIGFAFLPKYMGKGYGYESAKAVMTYAKNKLNILNLAAIVNANNTVSKSLLTKLGFDFIKIVKLRDGSEVEFMMPS